MSDINSYGGEIVWRPRREDIERSRVHEFMRLHGFQSFEELHEASIRDVECFTDQVIRFLGIRFQQPYVSVLDMSGGIQFPRWCVGARMNIVESCLDRWAGDSHMRDSIAMVWESEQGAVREMSYGELAAEVNRCANALRELSFGRGDAIGLLMPMTPEIVITFFAIARIGAVILPLFSGFGEHAIASRLHDAEAVALCTSDGLFRRGSVVDIKSVVDVAAAQVPTLRHIIVSKRIGHGIPMKQGRDIWWDEIVPRQADHCVAEVVDAEDPLMIIYTSGTTGKPKGAVHTHCGFPVKAAQDMAFGTDVHNGDMIYWMTDMGWMMGPWLLLGATILGARFFIYDGAPDYPGPHRLWAMSERHGINVLGISPTLIRALMQHGLGPVRAHDISSIRCFASTSEPWNPDPWMWLFSDVGERRIPIINYSGGTEISGGIVMGSPVLPLKPTAFSAACPGISADVYDEDGQPLRNAVGELVITAPWIGMTRGFWKDRDRYIETYWSRWNNVWVHGDFALIDDDGLWYILGRSDDTIKIAGKRVGPSEIESALVAHPAVSEAAAIGVPHESKGNEVLCFCVLNPAAAFTDEVIMELRDMLVRDMGKALAPKHIIAVSDVPKTRNGKIMRRMIRAAWLGHDPGDTAALANPETLVEIRAEAEKAKKGGIS